MDQTDRLHKKATRYLHLYWHARKRGLAGRSAQLLRAYKRTKQKLRAYRAQLRKHPRVHGNTVFGGHDGRERLRVAAQAAAKESANGSRHSFYSQNGRWTVNYGITGEPHGYRSDCSQWFISMYHSCGLPDPNHNNYNGGWTGTLGDHGKKIGRQQLKTGDAVLYGPYPHHHVEMYIGPGDKTIGHGSPPVDAGSIDMLAGPKAYRSYF